MKKSGRRVLIVEDEKTTADIIAFNLQASGHETECALDGDEAIRAIVRQRPDLIILDILMPGVSGWEVLDLLPGDQEMASIPVIILSGRDTSRDIATGWAFEISAYVTKPFEMRELLALVDRVLAAEGDKSR
jgi:DNA-binding response OmpR family regulator